MKRISRAVCGALLAALMMTGCGTAKVPETVDKPMLSIARDGEITEYLLGEFDARDYYSVSELSSMAAEEAARYNTAHQTGTDTPVKLEKAEALEDGSGRVCIVYRYDSAESYTGFNEAGLFYGTVGEAVAAGYSIDVELISVDGRERTFSAQQLGQAVEKRLIIAPRGVFVYCPGKVEYLSANGDMAEDGSVDTTSAEDPVYILLK